MENPAYIVLSRQTGLMRQMDVIANNLANTNTTGFKAERMMFSEFMTSKASNPGISGDGARVSFAGLAGTLADPREGPLEMTDSQLDFALNGPGYFVVGTPDGPRYTRDGHFQVDGTGQIVNRDGFPALDPAGRPLVVPANASSVEITAGGTLSSDKGAIGSLQIVKFDNTVALQKIGTNLYNTDQTPQRADPTTRVQQRMLETSNVQPIIEMTKMIDVQRAYESAQQMLNNQHDLQSQAIQILTKTS